MSATERAAGRAGRRRGWLTFTGSLVVTVGAFALLLSQVEGGAGQVVSLLKGVDRAALTAFFCLSLAMSVLRTLRYDLLLRISGSVVGFVPLFLVVLVRNFCSDLLPARVGTLVYVALLSGKLKVPLHAAGSSFSVAFLFDFIVMGPVLCLGALLFLPLGVEQRIVLGVFSVAVTAFSVWICFKLGPLFRRAADPFAHSQSRWVRAPRLAEVLLRASADTDRMLHSRVLLPVALLSFGIRALKYAAYLVFLYALLKPLDYSWVELQPLKALSGMLAAEASASLPFSGLLGFGLYEGTWAAVFTLLGFEKSLAVVSGIAHHLFTQAYGYALAAGALLLLMAPERLTAVFYRRQLQPSSPVALSAAGILAVAAVLLVSGDSAPTAAQAMRTQSSPQAAPEFVRKIAGRIVFDSKRGTTFGIYTVDPDGSALQPLVDDPHWHEMFPDPSPDGRWVVFARTRSLIREAPAEIWAVEIATNRQVQIAAEGTFPTFSADGRRVFFEQARSRLMALPFPEALEGPEVLEGAAQPEILFPKPETDFGTFAVVKPRVSPDGGRAAFTSDKGGRWHTVVADIATQKSEVVLRACEPAWKEGGEGLYLIKQSGMVGGSGILSLMLSGDRQPAVAEDGNRDLSHEYFPTAYEGLLLYGACPAADHDHNSAPYDLFIKDLNGGEVFQITSGGGYVNRWPKLLRVP